MASSAERALGRPLSKHRTDERGRRRRAVRALVTGIVVTVAGAAAAPAGLPLPACAVLVVLGLLLVCRGVVRARDARRAGTEMFTVRERGFAHRRAGYSRVVPWEDVTGVEEVRFGRPLTRAAGRDTALRIRLTDGTALRVTAFTEDPGGLAAVVREHTPAGAPPVKDADVAPATA
ncbi:PH domain-containing protein [Streptomyces sp. RFCAC02]|uniref:PH domain-containing protein n=1 Tax=Streptomyces sp. RFCAC02 TaxID=2499143 RepID=UPI001020C48B|nr:PH domain-containing protein [Streptomyces sp. RFCAC02]